jgi:hypothetical protein
MPADDTHAVWSFWSLPFTRGHRRRWVDDAFHLLSWVLSFHTVASRFASTTLVTDDDGARLLVDRLGLPFDHVSTALCDLRHSNPSWWILGKLHAYRRQAAPFVHFDSDVFLDKPLPSRLLSADVLAQNPQYAPTSDATEYRPTWFTTTVTRAGGWLPPEWHDYVTRSGSTAMCTGVVGGRATDLLTDYSERAISIVTSPRIDRLWHSIRDVAAHNVLVEQYYLAAYCACAERPDLAVRYLFASDSEAVDPVVSARVGFTHLIGFAKRSLSNRAWVVRRVRHEHPDYYDRCVTLAAAD